MEANVVEVYALSISPESTLEISDKNKIGVNRFKILAAHCFWVFPLIGGL